MIQEEVDQLTEEIDRVATVTEFNGQRLLNGEFSQKGYVNGNLDVKVSSYSRNVTAKIYNIKELVIEENPMPANESERYTVKADLTNGGFPDGATASIRDNLVTIQGVNGFEMTLDLTSVLEGGSVPVTVPDLEIDATGIGPMIILSLIHI